MGVQKGPWGPSINGTQRNLQWPGECTRSAVGLDFWPLGSQPLSDLTLGPGTRGYLTVRVWGTFPLPLAWHQPIGCPHIAGADPCHVLPLVHGGICMWEYQPNLFISTRQVGHPTCFFLTAFCLLQLTPMKCSLIPFFIPFCLAPGISSADIPFYWAHLPLFPSYHALPEVSSLFLYPWEDPPFPFALCALFLHELQHLEEILFIVWDLVITISWLIEFWTDWVSLCWELDLIMDTPPKDNAWLSSF